MLSHTPAHARATRQSPDSLLTRCWHVNAAKLTPTATAMAIDSQRADSNALVNSTTVPAHVPTNDLCPSVGVQGLGGSIRHAGIQQHLREGRNGGIRILFTRLNEPFNSVGRNDPSGSYKWSCVRIKGGRGAYQCAPQRPGQSGAGPAAPSPARRGTGRAAAGAGGSAAAPSAVPVTYSREGVQCA